MSLLTVGFDILGMSPLTIVWAALGLLEYINAAKCVRSPKAALSSRKSASAAPRCPACKSLPTGPSGPPVRQITPPAWAESSASVTCGGLPSPRR